MYHGSDILTPLDFIPIYNIIQVSIFKTYVLIQKVEDSRDILTFSFSVESIGIFFSYIYMHLREPSVRFAPSHLVDIYILIILKKWRTFI